ncbi:hypothetical protein N8A98_17440 [Devosia neptuniae]|jgi:hypothetical protein|uniref:Uncharacterized protein n=1 Tax=Devosia neptuniae TaxID=191302 RepID=A0ABY6C9V0_9HYPH|nr:hypothetical protein [Devosia neptuniae]UXN69009.1 hypothetical protein N8A98_17440 [Devosia neptuniae]
MSDLISIDRLEQLWRAYRAARAKAEATGEISDGIAAGKAWAIWLKLFLGRAA